MHLQTVDTCSRIRSAALQLFVEHGFQAVGLRQIARCIGIQPGSLYNHIDGKQELLFELVYDVEYNLAKITANAAPERLDPVARLRAFVGAQMRFALSNRDAYTLAFKEGDQLEGGCGVKVRAARRSRLLFLKGIITQGQRTGTFAPGACDVLVTAITSMLAGIAMADSSEQDAEQLVDFACRLVDRMV
ncbi:TetR/AcrR family transcriptional regulator [Pseudomonas putida]